MNKLLASLIFIVSTLVYGQYGEGIQYTKFTHKERKFNDWSVTAYGGTNFMQAGDLTFLNNPDKKWGWEGAFAITKHISHIVGIQLYGQLGETHQGNVDIYGDAYVARTEFKALSLLGAMNLTAILRRVDNKSPMRWNVHGYLGCGFIGYDTYRKVNDGDYFLITQQDLYFNSFFVQLGVELKYKLSRRFDLNLRINYVTTGDEEFDGSGEPYDYPSSFEDEISANYFNVNFGISFKIGKHKEHLIWFDPLHELYPPKTPETKSDGPADAAGACISGDQDNDGVCDDWDRELDTPAGARVDGAGVALDTDLDGIIDLYDKCPTYPSTNKETGGCPTLQDLLNMMQGQCLDEKGNWVDCRNLIGGAAGANRVGVKQPTKCYDANGVLVDCDFPNVDKCYDENGNLIPCPTPQLSDIQFELDSDKLTPKAKTILDRIAALIKKFSSGESLLIEGHTDARASYEYNMDLSQRRVNTVLKYLNSKGVDTSGYQTVGKGFTDLLYPECNPASACPEWKNLANRRVVFKIIPSNNQTTTPPPTTKSSEN